MAMLEKNWNEIRTRVILPLWNGKFKKMYEKIKMDYDDFESLAGIELTKAMKNFDGEKSNIYTYSTRVITKKAMTELRDCTQRDKRKTLFISDSIDRNSYDESSRTIVDNIPYEDGKTETSELSELRVGHFINSLDNNQLRILVLSLLDFDITDMPHMLNISNKMVQNIMHSLKDTDLTRVLFRRKF